MIEEQARIHAGRDLAMLAVVSRAMGDKDEYGKLASDLTARANS